MVVFRRVRRIQSEVFDCVSREHEDARPFVRATVLSRMRRDDVLSVVVIDAQLNRS